MTHTPWGGLVSYRDVTESTMDDAQALESDGLPDGSLAWAGPDLTQSFTVGEAVFVSSDPTSYWNMVAGTQFTVATYYVNNFGSSDTPSAAPAPFDGLSFSYMFKCGGPDLVAKSSASGSRSTNEITSITTASAVAPA